MQGNNEKSILDSDKSYLVYFLLPLQKVCSLMYNYLRLSQNLKISVFMASLIKVGTFHTVFPSYSVVGLPIIPIGKICLIIQSYDLKLFLKIKILTSSSECSHSHLSSVL